MNRSQPASKSFWRSAMSLASRRGVLGWAWAVVVTVAFLRDIRGQRRRARGVLLYERHLLDALATLETVYAGPDLGLARWLVRRFLPRADLTLFLEVSTETALSRKPADLFGAEALRGQVETCQRYAAEAPGLVRMDGTRPPRELATEAFAAVARLGS